jgi:hypothetical protein
VAVPEPPVPVVLEPFVPEPPSPLALELLSPLVPAEPVRSAALTAAPEPEHPVTASSVTERIAAANGNRRAIAPSSRGDGRATSYRPPQSALDTPFAPRGLNQA